MRLQPWCICDSTQNSRISDSCAARQFCAKKFFFYHRTDRGSFVLKEARITWTSRDSACAQGHDKRNALYFINKHQKLEFTNWIFRSKSIARLTKTNLFRSWYEKRGKICCCMTLISATNMHKNTCPLIRKPWLFTVIIQFMNCKQQPGKSAIKLKYDLHHKIP
jgi:hypothetical protein